MLKKKSPEVLFQGFFVFRFITSKMLACIWSLHFVISLMANNKLRDGTFKLAISKDKEWICIKIILLINIKTDP